MALHVQTEMVTSTEGSLTQGTFKWSVTGMLSEMPRQFVGACESPATRRVTAHVRLLTGVCPEMCF